MVEINVSMRLLVSLSSTTPKEGLGRLKVTFNTTDAFDSVPDFHVVMFE